EPDVTGDRVLGSGQHQVVQRNRGSARSTGAGGGQQAVGAGICGSLGGDRRARVVEGGPAVGRSVFKAVGGDHLSVEANGAQGCEGKNRAGNKGNPNRAISEAGGA